MGKGRTVFMVWLRNLRLLKKLRRKWDDNIQMELKVDSRTWASFFWFRIKETRRDLVNALMNLRCP
jgi:hypothetical protein